MAICEVLKSILFSPDSRQFIVSRLDSKRARFSRLLVK
ncbi:hypothetical protein COO91_08485 [Nostoc flagelliforme CCNUN1]|uniref:Uncharacterized protein n=1 Tax=Nostoc flagelliforme CCNUN1 TaxID=2038116 RepID=A0A2K8T415_9NOSO|nr:hypothetical protein COO91_08485 [Nostoc flagelliforme CCNUN1]